MTDKTVALEDRLRASFPLFLTLVWKSLDLPRPTRAQIAIARYLQDGPKRLQIQAFRGLGKSWIAAARKAGKSTFTWRGKKYNTKLRGE